MRCNVLDKVFVGRNFRQDSFQVGPVLLLTALIQAYREIARHKGEDQWVKVLSILEFYICIRIYTATQKHTQTYTYNNNNDDDENSAEAR